MSLYEKIINKEEKIALVGLGYVGMPIAVEFAKHVNVIGFDINKAKIEAYKNGIDPTLEVGDEAIKASTVEWTSDETKLKEAKFIIVAVPTPVNDDTTPDLTPVIGSSEIVGRNLTKGSIVVYESTVYPGVTEEVCVPILERESGLKCGVDFKVGYSPERINPGDKVHRLTTIKKIVSGMDAESLEEIANVYQIVVAAGVHRASCIKVAEAAKVIENSERDIMIAFFNELSKIFTLMGIDTTDVVEAAGTKWNFIKMNPGLVGGHCISVDPYYLAQCAQRLGYNPEIILAGRRMNDGMGAYVVDQTIKHMLKKGIQVLHSNVLIMGFTFKENCPDVRNTRVVDIYHALQEYNVNVTVYDPWANPAVVKHEYGIDIVNELPKAKYDAAIVAVAHKQFRDNDVDWNNLLEKNHVIFDVKCILPREMVDGRL